MFVHAFTNILSMSTLNIVFSMPVLDIKNLKKINWVKIYISRKRSSL